MYYNPWKEDRYGGRDEEMSLQKQGYVRAEESATCMVGLMSLLISILRNIMAMLSKDSDIYCIMKNITDCRDLCDTYHALNNRDYVHLFLLATYHRSPYYLF